MFYGLQNLVRFIPKPSGKEVRPISLTSAMGKLMEIMVHRRTEHFLEQKRLILHHQFGFRNEKSVIDCMGVLVTDVMAEFVQKRGTMALDIKGAFNALLPETIIHVQRQHSCSPTENCIFSHIWPSRKVAT